MTQNDLHLEPFIQMRKAQNHTTLNLDYLKQYITAKYYPTPMFDVLRVTTPFKTWNHVHTINLG